jgi:hypothetical protein
MDEAKQKTAWKQRLFREFVRYWINFVYLAAVFGLFAWYRRLILAEYDIRYLKYGVAILEALVLAKVILLGDMLGLGREFKNKPLIYPTLYNAIVFSLFVGVFAIIEHTIGGLLHGKGAMAGLAELRAEGWYELLARCLITFVMFIPFFAFKELANVLHEENSLGKLFFRKGYLPAT